MKKWTIKDILKVIGSSFLTILILTSLLNFTGLNDHLERTLPKSWLVFLLLVVQSLALILPLHFLVLKKYKNSLADLGFKSVKIWKLIKIVIQSYLYFIMIGFIVYQIQNYLGITIPGFDQQEPHLPFFGKDKFSLAAAFFLIVFFAPIVEEVFFRGFLFQSLKNKYSYIISSMISALIFAAIHLEFRSVSGIFILAMIINRQIQKTESIYPCIVFHCMNNAIALYLELYFTGV